MKFVDVLKWPNPYKIKLDLMPSIAKHTHDFLVSLAAAYKASFDSTEIDKFHNSIVKFRAKYKKFDQTLWIDSGGYSFISGKYGQGDIRNLMELYIKYVKNYHEDFDYFFSLDFPFRKNDDAFNSNLEKIKSINIESTNQTLKLLKDIDGLKEKFYFIIQFLDPKLFLVWRNIYSETDLKSLNCNRAIGGMVGSRKNKPGAVSPFIGVAYRAYLDFITSDQSASNKFKLHFLGINLLQDRFGILLLEKLFSTYTDKIELLFTYDTAFITNQPKKKHLNLPAFIPWDDNNYRPIINFDEINIGSDLEVAPESSILSDLEKIYDPSMLSRAREMMDTSPEKRNLTLKRQLEKLMLEESGKKIKKDPANLEIFDPFNILSHKCMDEIMSRSIDRLGLVENIINADSYSQAVNIANDFILNVSHCNEVSATTEGDMFYLAESSLFSTSNLLWSIRKNILQTYKFHKHFVEKRDDEKLLDKMVLKFIEEFNKPKA